MRRPNAQQIVAAQPIRPYCGPQYLVEPDGERADAADVKLLNDVPYTVLDETIWGWEPYNAIIRVGQPGLYCLVRIKELVQ